MGLLQAVQNMRCFTASETSGRGAKAMHNNNSSKSGVKDLGCIIQAICLCKTLFTVDLLHFISWRLARMRVASEGLDDAGSFYMRGVRA